MAEIAIGTVYNQTNSVAFSPQANYTEWATATSWQNLVPTFVDGGVSHGQRSRTPTGIHLTEPLLFFQVAPHLSSQGLSGPHSRPTDTQKIWQHRESNLGPLGLWPGTVTTRPQRWSQFSNKENQITQKK
jgi:hypothetical protein